MIPAPALKEAGHERPESWHLETGSDREAVVEQLNRDVGYDPVYTGPLQNAAAQEALLGVIFAISESIGPYVYRFAPVERL